MFSKKPEYGKTICGQATRNGEPALAFVPDRAHYFCIISSN
jgi:hypothetical protein